MVALNGFLNKVMDKPPVTGRIISLNGYDVAAVPNQTIGATALNSAKNINVGGGLDVNQIMLQAKNTVT